MAKEIERKFTVVSDGYIAMATESHRIVQAYLSRVPEATVRLRLLDDRAFLTVKSKNVGATRGEWEYEIPPADAREMLAICPEKPLEKTRYIVPAGDSRWEVDRFHGALEGLVVAEIELSSEDQEYVRPDFIGEEVTGDPRYYNSNLIIEAQA